MTSIAACPLRQNRASDSTAAALLRTSTSLAAYRLKIPPPSDRSEHPRAGAATPAREVTTIELDATPDDEQHRRWIVASTVLLAHEAVAPASTG